MTATLAEWEAAIKRFVEAIRKRDRDGVSMKWNLDLRAVFYELYRQAREMEENEGLMGYEVIVKHGDASNDDHASYNNDDDDDDDDKYEMDEYYGEDGIMEIVDLVKDDDGDGGDDNDEE